MSLFLQIFGRELLVKSKCSPEDGARRKIMGLPKILEFNMKEFNMNVSLKTTNLNLAVASQQGGPNLMAKLKRNGGPWAESKHLLYSAESIIFLINSDIIYIFKPITEVSGSEGFRI